MRSPDKALHAKHRSRVKQRFLRDGLDGFEPHNVLELLLFYGIPQCDTNVIAHELINKFGSLEGVFEADYKDLQTVKGVGENSASLIKLIPQISRYYLRLKTQDKVKFDSPDELAEYIRAQYLFEEREVFSAIYLDSAGKLISFDRIAEGSASHVDLNFAKIIEITISKNAAKVIVAHNHPAGNLIPSAADLHTTNKLSEIFKIVHIDFVDHMIITPDGYMSMAQHDKYWRYVSNMNK